MTDAFSVARLTLASITPVNLFQSFLDAHGTRGTSHSFQVKHCSVLLYWLCPGLRHCYIFFYWMLYF